ENSGLPSSSDVLRVSFALSGNGQNCGGTPCGEGLPKGSQGQLCCGENETVMVQLFCGPKAKGCPGALAQVSCAVKCGSPVKSPGPVNGTVSCVSVKVTFSSGAPAGSLLVRVMVCPTGYVPNGSGGKVTSAGENRTGWEQSLAPPSARQISP